MRGKKLIQLYVIICQFLVIVSGQNSWLDSKFPQNYNKHLPSSSYKDSKIVTVTCFLSPSSLTSLSIAAMDFGLESSFTIQWDDDRFKTKEHIRADLPITSNDKLWIPPIRLANCKMCDPSLINQQIQHVSLTANSSYFRFYVSFRQTFQLICSFDLVLFPFDTQECSIDFEMHDYGKRVVLEIRQIGVQKLIVPPEFALLHQYVKHCTNPDIILQTGTRLSNGCGKYVFRLRRRIGSFIILFYIPTILIVMVSWVSFWLDPDASASRVALALTALVTLATEFSSVQNKLPPVAYVKALDVWFFCCVLIVFASLAEFIFSTIFKRKTRYRRLAPSVVINANPMSKSFPNRIRQPQQIRTNLGWKMKCFGACRSISQNELDSASRALFPLIFLIFNIVYWTYYLSKYIDRDV